MKDRAYTNIICKGFCKYYKEGKEELHCGGYEILRNNFTPYELKTLVGLLKCRNEIKNHITAKNNRLINLICARCDFFIEECDYTYNYAGPPCGGYIIINQLYG
ncbi:hypothetical protein A45J_1014 [hot springs metagenome]|uniref:Uncharacterized protein n=1 Tax=hot springs metagenome TaxID=433727 RepID=A0A5J4KUP2_9ZZZZ